MNPHASSPYMFILKAEPVRESVSVRNLLIWLAGFLLYRFLMGIDTPVGNTLPDMALTILLCLIVNAVTGGLRKKQP